MRLLVVVVCLCILLDTLYVSAQNGSPFYRIDAGAEDDIVADGVVWQQDQFFTGGYDERYDAEIANTEDDFLYTTYHLAADEHGSFSYEIPVRNGSYMVRLHFAELFFTGAEGRGAAGTGQRVFDVVLENVLVLDDYDITADVGVLTAVVKTFPYVRVRNGILTIEFSASVDRPTVAAIEIYRAEMRIDSGSRSATTLEDVLWYQDVYYEGGRASAHYSAIAGTDLDLLYQTILVPETETPELYYRIPLRNGFYIVRLHFAEIYWIAERANPTGIGLRIFDVTLEDVRVMDDYDITAIVGELTTDIYTFEMIAVRDTVLDIEMIASVDHPAVAAIEIFRSG